MRIVILLLAVMTSLWAVDTAAKHPLIGSWKLTKAISRGKAIDPAHFPNTVRTFDGRFFVVSGTARGPRARYYTDDSTSPKKIKVEYLTGARAETVLHGIYEISGSVLKICVSQDGSAAPGRFESLEGSEITLEVYERTK